LTKHAEIQAMLSNAIFAYCVESPLLGNVAGATEVRGPRNNQRAGYFGHLQLIPESLGVRSGLVGVLRKLGVSSLLNHGGTVGALLRGAKSSESEEQYGV
jgi:hypothetical protein